MGRAFDARQLARWVEAGCELLQGKVKETGVRDWHLPAWPVATGNVVWRILREEGVRWINVD